MVAGATMVDAQFTLAKVFKPPANFEDLYEGKSTVIPVSMPGDLDPSAAKPGFDPRLIRGVDVPLGAKALLLFPGIQNDGGDLNTVQPYTYSLFWRLRNVQDFRDSVTKRKPYHLPNQRPSAPDTLGPSPGPRNLIPATTDSVVYNQAEPTVVGAPAIQNLHREAINFVIGGQVGGLPLVAGAPISDPQGLGPDTYGIVEQGVADPAVLPEELGPLFVPRWTICQGDELIIMVTRTDFTNPVAWEFGAAGADRGFSNIYGVNKQTPLHAPFPDLGVLLFTGSAPT